MTETQETTTTPRHKQVFYVATVKQEFANRTEAEKYINENGLEGEEVVLKGRSITPTEQVKMVLN